MTCVPTLPTSCLVDGLAPAVGDVASASVGNAFADTMKEGAGWVIRTTIGWWIDVPAIDLASSPAHLIRSYVWWLALIVATAGVMWQAIVLMFSRRPEPVMTMARGLFTLALWAGVGIAGPAAALRSGDAFASWVLDEAADGQAATRLVKIASLDGVESSGAVAVFGLLLMLAGLAQAVLMIFREGAVVVLAGVVVLAAAGSMTGATRPWLPRVLGWLLALIAYKPAAALVYACALGMVGTGNDPRTVVVGLTMMLLAIVALPALMRFFTWTSGTVTSGGGGLTMLAGSMAAAIQTGATVTSLQAGAAGHAEQLRRDLPSSGANAAAHAAPTGAVSTTAGPAAGGAVLAARGAQKANETFAAPPRHDGQP